MKSSLFLNALLLLTLFSCQSNQSSKPLTQTGESNHVVLIQEVLQVNGYSYLRITENNVERWLATPPVDAKPGDTYYYVGGFEMTNFKSKELNRSFESIYFLEGISSQPISAKNSETAVSPGATMDKDAKKEIKISPAIGGITIAELYANKTAYAGKTVKIKGQVIKFSPEIMKTNWIHLQDGTNYEGKFDLTITSDDSVKEGDIVVVEGKVTLDKDLGFGYFFDILIEQAKLSN